MQAERDENRSKISVIVGTRPEAIKLAPVVLALQNDGTCAVDLCLTGQHRQMLDPVIAAFGLTPAHDLRLMKANQGLAELTARAITKLDCYLEDTRPDLVLVEGDTATVLAAALAAFYRRIPLGHVEAGLRTWDMGAPWPEEGNRVLTSRLARLHFAPTELAKRNLLEERVPEGQIFVTGNTVIDALFLAAGVIEKRRPRLPSGLEEAIFEDGAGRKVVLITGHRRENFGRRFEEICHAIVALARGHPDVLFVYPIHLNPSVREPVRRVLNGNSSPNVILTDPLGYFEFVALMNRATLVLTDSGGIQEEAPSLGKPVLVMRDATERPEALESGTARLVGADRDRIVAGVSLLLDDEALYREMSRAHNPYGDGRAAQRIVQICKDFLSGRER